MPKQPFRRNRLTPLPKIKPLDPDKPLGSYRVDAPRREDFEHVPGQLLLGEDEPAAPAEGTAA